MRASSLLLAVLVLVPSGLPLWASDTGPNVQEKNHPPEVEHFFLKLEKRAGYYVAIVGEGIEGFVKARDPDGDVVSLVVVNFTLERKGLRQDVSLRENGNGTFPIYIPGSETERWEVGRYKIFITLEDERGAREVYEVGDELWLRKELQAPAGSIVWIYWGLAILFFLILVLAIAFLMAVKRRHAMALPAPPGVFRDEVKDSEGNRDSFPRPNGASSWPHAPA